MASQIDILNDWEPFFVSAQGRCAFLNCREEGYNHRRDTRTYYFDHFNSNEGKTKGKEIKTFNEVSKTTTN